MRPFCLIFPIIGFLPVLPALAQQPGGTVAGHVVCADTQRPARFATVVLIGVPQAASAAPKPLSKDASVAEAKAFMKASMGNMKMVQTQTGLDGAYSASEVAPGDYYVFASVPGYVQPLNLVQAAIAAGEDPSKSIAGVPQVHVTADRTAQAEVAVPRGAALSGHIRYDDGTPVSRAMVTLLPASGKKQDVPPAFGMLALTSALGGGGVLVFTDDLGAYRISGLAPGDFVVQAVLTTRSSFAMQGGAMNLGGSLTPSTLTVYAPAAFHKADAKPVTLHAGEERTDEDLAFNLIGLQTVSGTVSSASDHHHLNAGTIELADATDKDFKRSASVDANGNYSLLFVPAGTYTLSVSTKRKRPSSSPTPRFPTRTSS
jgi:hypothetical protein